MLCAVRSLIYSGTSSRLSRNTFALLVSNAGSNLLSLVLQALIARVLGKDGLGAYATALAWITPLSLLAEFGLGTLITRDVAQDAETAAEYLRATTVVRMWLGGGLVLLLVFAAPLLSSDPNVVRGLQISAPLIVINPFFGAFTAVFRARQVMAPITWLNLGMLVAQVGLTVLVFAAGGDIIAAFIVNTATSAGQFVAAWGVWRWRFKQVAVDGAKHVSPIPKIPVLPLLRRAFPFAVAAVLAALQTRVGTILLEHLTDTGNVGYYAAATRFVEAGRNLIPNALFGALFPALAALAANTPELRQLFRRMMLLLTAYSVALGVGVSLLGFWIMTLIYGASFSPAVPVLQLAMWSLLPSLLRAGQTLYWYAQGREQFVNWVTGVTLVLQVPLSLWLIPQYGAIGVAVVSLVIESVAFVLLVIPRGRLKRARESLHEAG